MAQQTPTRPKPKARALTPKRKRFVEEYLKDGNGTRAAIEAGYKPDYADRQAYQIKGAPGVAEAIEKGQERLLELSRMGAAEIMGAFERIAAKHEDSNPAAANQALQSLAKMQGLWVDKAQVDQTVRDATPQEHRPEGLDDAIAKLKLVPKKGAA